MKFKFFLFFLLASCSVKEQPKDTLFVVLDSRPQTLDPRKATSANGMRLIGLIFNSFVKQGNQGELKPDLALSWKLDNLTWIFTLKPNLKFSNGRSVLKEDILFSFEEFQKKSSSFYSAFKNIKSVEVLNKEDSNTTQFIVKIHLKSFQAPFIYSDLPVLKILPKNEILKAERDFNKYPIGTGNWTVVKNDFRQILLKRKTENKDLKSSCLNCNLMDQAISYNLKSVEGTYQKESKSVNWNSIRMISFNIIRDSLTRTQKMLSKEMDIAPSVIPLDKISQFKKKNQDFKVFSSTGFSTTYLLINLKNNFFKNKKLRYALSLAINREEIIKYKLYGYASPALSFINPNSYFFNKNLKSFEFNLSKASSLIEQMNLKNLELRLSCSNNSSTVSKARVLASQISKAGLKISLQTNEWGAFYKDVGRGSFDLALMKWVGVVDPDIYRIAFHSENQAPQGRDRGL
ncbi:MAG: ABC transporter substrate-binding protein [Bdellovibrionaceae bacterium]|nr:ABC transporter substrate-binding protein [Pseudobdellovibrionaceae bacterium]